MKKIKRNQIVPPIVAGGQAIPLGDNYFYMQGRSHERGGIDIGANPRTGLEVEGGEVIKTSPKEMRVYSSVPFLGGFSPAELLMRGNNPDVVFEAQEEFKRRNKLNDDGSSKGRFGLKTRKEKASLGDEKLLIEVDEHRLGGREQAKNGILKRIGNKISNFYWHTLRAPKNYTDEEAILRNGCTTDECAKWANDNLQAQGYSIFGDAWTRTSNKRVKKIYSGYNRKDKPKKYNEELVDDYIYAAADSLAKTLDPALLKQGDITGLFFRNSPNKEKAFEKGTNGEAQTHTGNIVVEDGVPYVVHNVHGKLIKNKAEDLLGSSNPYGIVSVYRPYKLGGINKMKQRKQAALGVSDWLDIGSGVVDILGNIGGYFNNRAALKDQKALIEQMKGPDAPSPLQAVKLKTHYNIQPQLDAIREAAARYERDVDNNTSSSQVALARKQRNRLQSILQGNQLRGQKENIETQLINQDNLNRQQVSAQNNQQHNQWLRDKNTVDNQRLLALANLRDQEGEALIGMLEGISNSISGAVGGITKRAAEDLNLKYTQRVNPNGDKILGNLENYLDEYFNEENKANRKAQRQINKWKRNNKKDTKDLLKELKKLNDEFIFIE